MSLSHSNDNELVAKPSLPNLFIGTFSSAFSTTLLLLSLAYLFYTQGGSIFLAGLVFVMQWFSPILFIRLISFFASAPNIKRSLVVVEILQLTLLAGFFYLPASGILIALILRGLLDSISKSARNVYIKNAHSKKQLESSFNFINAAQYVGLSSSGVGVLFLDKNGLDVVIFIAMAMHCISFLSYLLVKPIFAPTSSANVKQGFIALFSYAIKNQLIRRPFIYLLIVTGFLQGFHNIARASLPAFIQGASLLEISFLQVGVGPAILLGLTAYSYLRKKEVPREAIFIISSLLSALTLLLVPFFTYRYISIFFYLSYMFFFEIAYSKLYNEIMLLSTKEDIAYISTITQVSVMGAMAIVILLLSSIISITSPFIALLVTSTVIFIMTIFHFFTYLRNKP